MKELLIMRHSKTESQGFHGKDFSRNLTEKGIAQSESQGQFLASQPFVPQKIIVSPSNRTQQTLAYLLPKTEWSNTEVQSIDKLYHASLSILLKTISETNEEIQRLMIIGHNFGVLDLVQYFSNEYLNKYKTGSISLFQFQVESWSLLEANVATKMYLKAPVNE